MQACRLNCYAMLVCSAQQGGMPRPCRPHHCRSRHTQQRAQRSAQHEHRRACSARQCKCNKGTWYEQPAPTLSISTQPETLDGQGGPCKEDATSAPKGSAPRHAATGGRSRRCLCRTCAQRGSAAPRRSACAGRWPGVALHMGHVSRLLLLFKPLSSWREVRSHAPARAQRCYSARARCTEGVQARARTALVGQRGVPAPHVLLRRACRVRLGARRGHMHRLQSRRSPRCDQHAP